MKRLSVVLMLLIVTGGLIFGSHDRRTIFPWRGF
jgi:hypothetical protein